MPQESRRASDKRTTVSRGESYEDVIRRLDLVVIELERTRRPVLVIAHNAVIARCTRTSSACRRALPHLDIPRTR